MNLTTLKKVYFLGIGGIGMSAIARYFLQLGVEVSGYDKTPSIITRELEEGGARIHYTDEINLLNKEAELVIYTPAIPKESLELNWYKDNNYPVWKRSDVLQWITEHMYAITIAGTHGKTTITTMIAYLLRESGVGCNAFLGGISSNYETNYWSSGNGIAVIEADEYDRSFLKLSPDVAILTAMDADHLDIYGTKEAMEEAFIQYTKNIKPEGILFYKHGLHHSKEFTAHRKMSYSLQNDAADVYAEDIRQHDGGYYFNLQGKNWTMADIYLPIGGMHNVENAVVAIAAASMQGAKADKIRIALKHFKGVKRRFEYAVKTDKQVYIDDYAHHPEELSALIKSAKGLFPGRKCVIAFQPHLFSRTRDLAAEFAHSLDMADQVLLLDIYPAREKPMEGVSSRMIADLMQNKAVTILSKDALIEFVKTARPDLFITAGAGDIDQLVPLIKDILG